MALVLQRGRSVANVFDQFDTAQQPAVDVTVKPYAAPAAASAANPFDQFDAKPVNVPLDVAKSAGVGLGEGAIGTLGSVGDIRSALSSGVDWLGNKLGFGPQQNLSGLITGAAPGPNPTVQAFKQAITNAFPGGQAIAAAPTSQQIQSGVEGITGPFYQPQSGLGEAARTIGQYAPGAIAGPGGIVRRAVTQAVIPGLASEAAGQVYKGTELEPYARAIAGVGGAVAGAGLPGLARKAITPFPVSAARQEGLDTLAQAGVPVSAGQATGSKMLKVAETELGGGAANLNEKMQGDYTRAIGMKAAGIDAPQMTPEVLVDANKRIGGMFDAVAARNPQIPVPGFPKIGDAIVGDYFNHTGKEAPPILNDIRQRIGDVIDGRRYQAINTELGAAISKAETPAIRSALVDMKSALDKAVQTGLKDPADAQAWAEARRQWGGLKTIENAVSGPGESAAYGYITPSKLTNAIQSWNQSGYVLNRSDLAPLARAGNQIMKPYQDSGTATRGFVKTIPALVMGALAGGIHPYAIAAGALGPMVGGKALMSGPVQRYLANQAFLPGAGTAPVFPGALLPAAVGANQLRRPSQQ